MTYTFALTYFVDLYTNLVTLKRNVMLIEFFTTTIVFF